MKNELLEKYARLAVCSGINIQKKQPLVINASVKDYQFVEMCVREAYLAGSGPVSINWSYENNDKMYYQYVDEETLAQIPDWQYDKRKYYQDKGAAFLSIVSDTPGYFADVDQSKIKAHRLASFKKMAPLREYTMANRGQWCIVALPSIGWAKKIFPDLSDEEAVERLMEAILTSVRIDEESDPVEKWQQHDHKLADYCAKMNEYAFSKLHFVSPSLKTDLYVGLVKNHIWAGGSCFTSTTNVEFNPNMPTEEIFCMPERENVEGIVYASKPLSYSGKVIENFWFLFEKGRVVDYGAEKNVDALTDLLDSDEGSRHLGEVALISYDSPISLMNILFYETLFDENASCHLALGDCYPENIKGGLEMNEEEIIACGGNKSMNHVDFMFGTKDMEVTGIKENGEEVAIFVDGNFVL